MVTVAVVSAFVLIVVAVALASRLRGARRHHLDTWEPGPGEERRLEVTGVDFHVVPRLGQARVMTFARPGRSTAVVTDRALVIATRALLSKRYAITHVVHLAPEAGSVPALGQLGGGLFTVGTIAYAASADGITEAMDGRKPYVRIVPDRTRSATNVEHLRLYCDDPGQVRSAMLAPPARG